MIRNFLNQVVGKCGSLMLLGLLGACTAPQETVDESEPVAIAFMPDIHFHDIYGDFQDGSFAGLHSESTGLNATMRTMQAQLHSTRLFNENYFALLAALDDAARRGITLVALPGDFSDDGQPVHIRGLAKIFKHYEQRYGMRFFAAPGNHDPTRPFTTAAGKADYLGESGRPQRLFSRGAQECEGYGSEWTVLEAGYALPTICTEEVRELGYQPIMTALSAFGFSPSANDVYWETPFSDYAGEPYSLRAAKQAAAYSQRQYEICREGSGGEFRQPEFTDCAAVPDTSYLVEPVEGLWLLAIDANVYLPKGRDGETFGPLNGEHYHGAGNAGYNKVLTHKRHLLAWIEDVVRRAERQGKRLIAFSHYPMTEFYDGQSDDMATFFGADSHQLARRPSASVGEVLAQTGLKIHVGGHMHINDTGTVRTKDGHFLFNIQAPSLAAYMPGYKVLTVQGEHRIDVETVTLDQVPRFDELFEHYAQEYRYLQNAAPESAWDKSILDSDSYRAFTESHLRQLTQKRFLAADWPESLREVLASIRGQDWLVLSFLSEEEGDETPVTLGQWRELTDSEAWTQAQERAALYTAQRGILFSDYGQWSGMDLAVDFYRVRNAGHLALSDIGPNQLFQYTLLEERLRALSVQLAESDTDSGRMMQSLVVERLYPVLRILSGLRSGEPDVNFTLDTHNGELIVSPEHK